MKKLFYILILITGVANAQIVNIPDANFKARLLGANPSNFTALNQNNVPITIDTNANGEIDESETLNVAKLYLSISSITNITGIEAFQNLVFLDCSNNELTSLNVSGLTQLQTLNCSYNFITSLDVSGLTQLQTLDCFYNFMTNIDFTNCPNLNHIDCSFNSISVIDLTGLNSVDWFSCYQNLISNIVITNFVEIGSFEIGNNLLINLDLSNVKVTSFSSLNNSLRFLNLKNGFDEEISQFLLGNNGIVNICQDGNQSSELENYLFNLGVFEAVVTSYCTFTPGGNYNTIVGQVQLDGDNNGCDVNDGGLQNVRINITDGTETGATFSNANGGYTFYTQALNQELSVATENPTWFTVSPATASVSFTDINNNQILQNFCVTSNGVHDDVEVVIVPTIPARPGFDATYKIVYRNKGNTIAAMNSGISLSFNDDLMDFLSSTQTVVAQDIGFLAWDVTSLLPFESKSFEVVFNINAPTDQIPVNNDDVLTFTSIINVSNNDENTADNTFVLNQTVVGSYDPNDITCLEGDIVSPTEIGEYLHYNIRFENTGTFYAENIVVKTEINPAEFDINTLQLLNASHPVDARIRGNIIEFIFQGIYLDTGGHGNVLLKLKTKPTLQTGDLVKNKANIYFDYNFPILTNDAETVFQSLSNPDFEVDNSVKIYPNPSNAVVNIKSDFNIKSIQLYDVQGRILQTNIVEENTTSLDITSKSKGIYFLKVITDKGIKVEKLVKE